LLYTAIWPYDAWRGLSLNGRSWEVLPVGAKQGIPVIVPLLQGMMRLQTANTMLLTSF